MRKFPTLRNYLNEYIESRELNCASIRKIVPVSALIADQITEKYSSTRHKLAPPIPPGVSPLNTIKKEYDPDVPVIGFMGKEWKRKGLPKVIDIWRELRKEIPLARLCLAGFAIDEPIGILKNELKFVDLLGHVARKEDFYEKIDILLHPAQREAYGMVIAEALSIGISVLCSKETGASTNLENGLCDSLPYDNSIQFWGKLVIEKLNSHPATPSKIFCNSWSETAKDYKRAYENVLLS
jgi:UDP-glucose:(heptosyl)LPS alpha-1,3-glucosyltransferase